MIAELNDELRLLRETVALMAEREFRSKAAFWDRAEEAPLENLPTLAKAGLAGITVPEQYGGSGGDVFHAMIAVEELAKACPTTAGMVLGNAVVTEMLIKFGSEDQRQQWLPAIAAGESLSAWAMTEPGAGSAATEMLTSAISNGEGYVLNGQKVFITRAVVADVFIVFARIDKVPGAKGIGAFLVPKHATGLALGQPDHHMGFRGAGSAEVLLDDCHVSEQDMLVPAGDFGKMMRGLNIARVLNPTICLGIAADALAQATRYSQERRQFGRDIASFQGIQWMLADMHVKVDAMRLLIYRAASSVANGDTDAPLHAAVAKIFANEGSFQVVDAALQIHGGYGYSQEFPIERMLRDVRGFQIAGGSTQTLRNTVASRLLGRRLDQRSA